MVKLENGMLNKDDKNGHGDCQELLSPPQPLSPTSPVSHSVIATPGAGPVSNGCHETDNDQEQEPLLQESNCKAVSKCEGSTKSKVDYNLQNGDLTIPIYVTSDRLSVDTAATASLHSSPSHGVTNGIRGSSVINPSLLQTAGVRDHQRLTPQVPLHDEVVSIQMTAANSCRNLDGPRQLTDREVFECSWQSMCGPKPKKVTIVIVVILSLWASFILGLNVYMQVSSLQTNLTFMTEKVHILQRDYLQMHDLALHEIQKLKSHLEELTSKQHNQATLMNRPHGSTDSDRNGKSVDLSDERKSPKSRSVAKPVKQLKAASTTATTSPSEGCTTVDGVPCIFPFTFNGEVKTGCVQRWIDIKPWCATKVDDNGNFISFDTSGWGNCNKSCPKS